MWDGASAGTVGLVYEYRVIGVRWCEFVEWVGSLSGADLDGEVAGGDDVAVWVDRGGAKGGEFIQN